MNPLTEAIAFLTDLERRDLAQLLKFTRYRLAEADDGWGGRNTYVELSSPQPHSDALAGLPPQDKKRVFQAVAHQEGGIQGVMDEQGALIFTAASSAEPEPFDALLAEVVCQRDQMIAVATGGPRINDVNDFYRSRRKRIRRLLTQLEVEDPNPFDGLWDWYSYWREYLEGYASRRSFVHEMYKPVIERLCSSSPNQTPERAPTGWANVDRVLEKARSILTYGKSAEDYQQAGLLCREGLISLAQIVFDEERHSTPDGVRPSRTDAGRMLEAYLSSAVPGSTNENVRRHAKASLKLAVELQHKRTAKLRDAELCVEATASTVSIVSIISRRQES